MRIMGPRLVSAEELATYIGTTKKSIYTYKCQGKIPKQWIVPVSKRSIRFDLSEVDKSIEETKGSTDGLESIFRIRA